MTKHFLRNAPPAVQALFGEMWADINRASNEAAERAALANPVKHRNSRIFRGDWSYRYYQTKNGRGSIVRHCYSTVPNVAGYFLIWREVETKKHVKRDRFDSTKIKADAINVCRRRAGK